MTDFNELARTDREAAIKLAMEKLGLDRRQAERFVAIQAGDDMRDMFVVDEEGGDERADEVRPYWLDWGE